MSALYHLDEPCGNGPMIDSALDANSPNTVKNSVITAAINFLKGLIGWTLTSYTTSTNGGKTTITFSNALIQSTSELHIYTNGASSPIFYTGVTFTSGSPNSVAYEFNASDITSGITFSLKVRNSWLSPS